MNSKFLGMSMYQHIAVKLLQHFKQRLVVTVRLQLVSIDHSNFYLSKLENNRLIQIQCLTVKITFHCNKFLLGEAVQPLLVLLGLAA